MSEPFYTGPDGLVEIHNGDSAKILRDFPENHFDAIVTDPPYGLRFMGKRWDYDLPPETIWRQCFRVLKPGGHLLSFGGTRTYHRLAVAIEEAGFEIRDMIAWVYGSGFPKSLDVSKAIDRKRHDRAEVYLVTAWIRETRDAAGITNRQIDDAFGFCGMAGHWTSSKSQPSIPTLDQIPPLLDVLGVKLDDVPDEIRRLIWTLNGRKGQPGAAWYDREIIGTAPSSLGGTVAAGERDPDYIDKHRSHDFNITAPATEAAKQWQGWGSALKPAFEPVTVARKPMPGTIAANVLEHGTGAINVDGCRIGVRQDNESGWSKSGSPESENRAMGGKNYERSAKDEAGTGRFPANLAHDGSPEAVAGFPATTSKGHTPRDRGAGGIGCNGHSGQVGIDERHHDTGSAARFFYCAKASQRDRDEGVGDSNRHPTVKPINLMRWLCRLVTPPGGLILDPFLGSGSTGKAAIMEGFRFVGVELEEAYCRLARERIRKALEQGTLAL